MPEPKFIDNQEKEIETVALYPTKATDVNKNSEDSQVIVTRKPPIWKHNLVLALIFLSVFATTVVFHRVRRHFHGRGRFDHDKHHHHPHDGQHEPDDETLVFFENGFQDDKMFEQSHPMLPSPMNDPQIKNQGMRHHGKDRKHDGKDRKHDGKDRKHDGSNRKHPPFFHSDSSISSSISSDIMYEEEPQDIMLHPPMNDPQMKNQGMRHHGKSRKHDGKNRKHDGKNRKDPRFVDIDISISSSMSSMSSDSMDEEERQDVMLHPPMNDPEMKNQGMRHLGKSRKHDGKSRKHDGKNRKDIGKNRKHPKFLEPQDIMDNMMEPLPESEKEQYNPDIYIAPEVELEDIDPLVSFEDKLNEESFINVSRQEESP